MEVDLRHIFSLEEDQADSLDLFISERLYEANVCASDGISWLRIVEREPERVRVCGRIYAIEQTLHVFWLDLEREPSGIGVTWVLYFDVVADSPRRTRNAIDLHSHANEIDWRITLAGRGEVREGTLVVT